MLRSLNQLYSFAVNAEHIVNECTDKDIILRTNSMNNHVVDSVFFPRAVVCSLLSTMHFFETLFICLHERTTLLRHTFKLIYCWRSGLSTRRQRENCPVSHCCNSYFQLLEYFSSGALPRDVGNHEPPHNSVSSWMSLAGLSSHLFSLLMCLFFDSL